MLKASLHDNFAPHLIVTKKEEPPSILCTEVTPKSVIVQSVNRAPEPPVHAKRRHAVTGVCPDYTAFLGTEIALTRNARLLLVMTDGLWQIKGNSSYICGLRSRTASVFTIIATLSDVNVPQKTLSN